MNHIAEDTLKEQIKNIVHKAFYTTTGPSEIIDQLLALFTSTLQQEHARARTSREEKLIEEIKKIVYSCYTDETEEGYHEDEELNKAHNAGLDLAIFKINQLSAQPFDAQKMKKTGKLVGVCNCQCHCDLPDCFTDHDNSCEHCQPRTLPTSVQEPATQASSEQKEELND